MAKKAPVWSIQKQIRAAKPLESDEPLIEKYSRNIEAWIADPLKPMRNSDAGEYPAVVSVDLYLVGVMIARRGIIAVLEGRSAGWEDIGRGAQIAYWTRRMEFRLARFRFGKSGKRHHLLDRLHTGCVFGITYALGMDEPASRLADELLADPGNESLFSNVGDFSPLNPFTYRIAGEWRNRPTDTAKIKVTRSCPAYDDVWRFWRDPEQLGGALDAVAAFHVANNNTARERDEMDFYATFGEEIPWEVLAVLRMRREQGLADPPLTHPFLLCPLMSPPFPLTPARDESLERAVAAGRVVFPDL